MAKSNDPKSKIKDNAYLKYSGMAFQIIAYILVGIFLGDRLDKYFEMDQPVFTAILAMVFLCLFFFKLYVDLNRKSSK
ncbi:MAG: AtpZ/AtpI family protein [Saprospiraceae bacterium]|nr:AtpZ/AtpI family protein [Saprospiraceae bacterium]